jgi:hypothetical protein
VKEVCVRCLADELSACEARHQQHLKQAEEKYLRNLTALQKLVDNKTQEVTVLKQAMKMKPDKLRGQCENSKLTEELAVCKKEWQARLKAETAKWQARLEEHEQDVETE